MIISALLLGFVAIMATFVVAFTLRYLDARTAFRVLAALAAWFIYAGLMGYFGVFKNATTRPPGPAFLLLPVIIFLVFFIVRSAANARIAWAFPLWILLAAQFFRVGVELFLHHLWLGGYVPKMLTFDGANVDIYIGATAPLIAWFASRSRFGMRVALAWNVLGLLSLANVFIRAVLTTPGPLHLLHSEFPNLIIGTFPFLFIPAFFVPLAVVLHVLAIESINRRLRTAA